MDAENITVLAFITKLIASLERFESLVLRASCPNEQGDDLPALQLSNTLYVEGFR